MKYPEPRWLRDERVSEDTAARKRRYDIYWEDWVRTRVGSLPFVKNPSGGSGRMHLRCSKIDCSSLMQGGLNKGYPWTSGVMRET